MRTAKVPPGLGLPLFFGIVLAACVTVKPAKISVVAPDGWTQDMAAVASDGTRLRVLSHRNTDVRVTVSAEPTDGRAASARLDGLVDAYRRAGSYVAAVDLSAPDGATRVSAAACSQNVPSSPLHLGVRYVDSPPGRPSPPELPCLKRYGDDIQVTWFSVTSPKARPDLLVVVTATWHGYLPGLFREELIRIMLSATAE